jgi:hypothetical protein
MGILAIPVSKQETQKFQTMVDIPWLNQAAISQ